MYPVSSLRGEEIFAAEWMAEKGRNLTAPVDSTSLFGNSV